MKTPGGNTLGNVCAVQWRLLSTVEAVQYSKRANISAVEGLHQNSGSCSLQWWANISTVEG